MADNTNTTANDDLAERMSRPRVRRDALTPPASGLGESAPAGPLPAAVRAEAPTTGPTAGEVGPRPLLMPDTRMVDTPAGPSNIQIRPEDLAKEMRFGNTQGGELARTANTTKYMSGDPYAKQAGEILGQMAVPPVRVLGWFLEPLDLGRRWMWSGSSSMLEALPEEGEVADIAKGAITGGWPAQIDAFSTYINAPGMVVATATGRDTEREDPETYERSVAAIGERMYSAMASGKLAQRNAETGEAVEILGGWESANLTGLDLLDMALPKDAAAQIRDSVAPDISDAVKGGRGQEWVFWNGMATSDTFRMVHSVIPELILDPLNVVGPGAGSKVVAIANVTKGGERVEEAYRVARPVVRAAEALALATKDTTPGRELRKLVSTIVTDPAAVPTKVADARSSLVNARADAASMLATAQANNAGSQEIMRLTAAVRDLDNADAALKLLGNSLTEWGMVTRSGLGAISVPVVGERTFGHLTDILTPVRKLSNTVGDMVKPYSFTAISKRIQGVPASQIATVLDPGEQLAYALYMGTTGLRGVDPVLGVARNAARWVVDMPQVGWSILARYLGPRTIFSTIVNIAKSSPIHAVTEGTPLAGRELKGTERYRKMDAISPSDRQSTVEAVTKFMNDMSAGGQRVLHSVMRAVSAARDTLKARRAAGILDPEETVASIIFEAMDAVERGSGRLQGDLARLAPVVESIRGVIRDMALATARSADEVRTAATAIERRARGSVADFKELSQVIREADELWRHFSANAPVVYGEAFDALVVRWRASSQALHDVLTSVTPSQFSEALVNLQGVLRGKTVGRAERYRAARMALAQVLGTEATADRVIAELARGMGLADPADAMPALLELVHARSSNSANLEAAFRAVAAEMQTEANVAQAAVSGQVDARQMAKALAQALSASASKRIAAARGLVGDVDWADFVEWSRTGKRPGAPTPPPPTIAPAPASTALAPPVPVEWRRAKLHWDRAMPEIQQIAVAASATAKVLEDTAPKAALRLFIEGVNASLARVLPSLPAGSQIGRQLNVAAVIAQEQLGGTPAALIDFARNAAFGKTSALQASRAAVVDAAVEARPRLPAAKGMDPKTLMGRQLEAKDAAAITGRTLDGWEVETWERIDQLVHPLNREDRLLAVIATLYDAPAFRHMLDDVETWGARYGVKVGDIMGTRMAALRPDLAPVVRELQSLMKGFEDRFRASGVVRPMELKQMLEEHGVVGYVPHIESTKSLTARDKQMAARRQLAEEYAPREGDTVESILSTDLDARQKREIGGTIAEISAASNTSIRETADPALLIARYTNANRALSAQAFVVSLLQAGVIKSVAVGSEIQNAAAAAERGLVPLLIGPENALAYDVLMRGTRGDLEAAGITAAQAASMLAELKAGRANPFATWMRSIPLIQRAEDIEEMILALRVHDLSGNHITADDIIGKATALITGSSGAKMSAARAWDEVAEELNRTVFNLGVDRKTNGASLRAYFDPKSSARALWVPAAVAQSLDDMFNVERLVPNGLVGSVKGGLDWLNNFWKVRLTVVNAAFHSRNYIYNTINSIFDTGAFGVTNPVTQYTATTLVAAAHYVDKYGSVEAAYAALSSPRRAGESAAAHALRASEYQLVFPTVERALRRGIDLGDGVARPVDDVVRRLTDMGVLTGAYTNFADLSRIQHELGELLATGGSEELVNRLMRYASIAEDAGMLLLTTTMAGIPVMLPKQFGSAVAAAMENQSRAVNFIANFRGTRSWEDAAEHVNKYLFNYQDLNAFQRVWGRTIIPFFTWPTKNLALQLDILVNSPRAYGWWTNLMIDEGPRVVDAATAEAEDAAYDRLPVWGPTGVGSMDSRSYGRIQFRLPKKVVLQGFGSPQEGALEYGNMIAAFANPAQWYDMLTETGRYDNLQILSVVSFAPVLLAALQTDTNYYQGEPLAKLNNARGIAQTIAGLRSLQELPGIFGATAGMLADTMVETTEFNIVRVHGKRAGTYMDVPIANPSMVHLFANMPWRQGLMNAAAGSDAFHISTIEPGAGDVPDVQPLPQWMRWADALLALSFTQRDPAFQRRKQEREAESELGRLGAERGNIRESELYSTPKR